MSMASIELLRKFELLQGVEDEVLEELIDAAEERTLEPGAELIRQGRHGERVYLLLQGALAVYLDRVEGEPLAVVQPGETVGEMSLLDGSVASAHVVVHATPCAVLAVDEPTFLTLTTRSHAFAVQLLRTLVERLRSYSSALSRSTETRRMYERAAMFDALTGVHNRRWIDDTLARLSGRGTPVCIGLIDIDHFKTFNDSYGHEAGDVVLTGVATTLAKRLRPTDLLGRYGGDEFVLIFPNTDLDQAECAANRVSAAVASERFVMSDGRELPRVTLSMGVAELASGMDVGTLFKIADVAMYRAKRAGRNQVARGTAGDLVR